jgi:hypothetical protein
MHQTAGYMAFFPTLFVETRLLSDNRRLLEIGEQQSNKHMQSFSSIACAIVVDSILEAHLQTIAMIAGSCIPSLKTHERRRSDIGGVYFSCFNAFTY